MATRQVFPTIQEADVTLAGRVYHIYRKLNGRYDVDGMLENLPASLNFGRGTIEQVFNSAVEHRNK